MLHLLLASFMALSLTWGHDWVHVPELVKHFQEHATGSPDMGFLQFLALHYSDTEHRASDRSHDQLPFQHSHHGAGIDFCTTKVIGNEPPRAVSFPERNSDRAFLLPDADALLSGHASDLLRPPRILA